MNDFEIIIAGLIVLLFVAIFAIVRMNMLLNRYADYNRHFTEKQLIKIDEAAEEVIVDLKKFVTVFNEKIRKDYEKNSNDLKELTKTIDGSLQVSVKDFSAKAYKISADYLDLNSRIEKAIEKFLSHSLEDMRKHLQNVSIVSNDVKTMVNKLDETIIRNKELHKKSAENYDKLESVTDKTKELVGKHEVTIDNYTKDFEQAVKSLNTKYRDVVNELTAKVEIVIGEMAEDFSEKMNIGADNSIKSLKDLLDQSQNTLEKLTEQNIKSITTILNSNHLKQLIEQNAILSSQLEAYLSSNNKTLNEVMELSKNRITEVEEKLINNTKKRGLFG